MEGNKYTLFPPPNKYFYFTEEAGHDKERSSFQKGNYGRSKLINSNTGDVKPHRLRQKL